MDSLPTRRDFLRTVGIGAGMLGAAGFRYAHASSTGSELGEMLGYGADAKLLIITGDEFGENHASNQGVIRALEDGLLTGVTLMPPCPWTHEAVEYLRMHPDVDVGVHLALTGVTGGPDKPRPMRWRPLLSKEEVPGLYGPDGYVWGTGRELWDHATPEEVLRECQAQIEQALLWRLDITHIDPHDGLYAANPEVFGEIYADLGQAFMLPLRMPGPDQGGSTDVARLRGDISRRGILMSDEWLGSRNQGETLKQFYIRRFREMRPGVMDIWTHPAVDTPELRAAVGEHWTQRVEDLRLLTEDPDIRRVIEEENIRLIQWREIRDLQREMGKTER